MVEGDLPSTAAKLSLLDVSGRIVLQQEATEGVNRLDLKGTYNDRTFLARQTAANNRQITDYTYLIGPGNNQVISTMTITNAPAQTVISVSDGFGKSMQTIRGNDGAVLNTAKYDNFWRPIETSELSSGTVVSTYEPSPASRLISTLDEEDNVYKFLYFGQGAGSDDGEGLTNFYKERVIDPNGHPVTKSYNAKGLLN
ncbi:MAG: hypothetical protein AAGA62_06690, partial [Bacteroidota bacterium]